MSMDEANDIDILVVYSNLSFDIIKDLKRNISISLQREFLKPVHFTTLSLKELQNIKNIKLEHMHLVVSFT